MRSTGRRRPPSASTATSRRRTRPASSPRPSRAGWTRRRRPPSATTTPTTRPRPISILEKAGFKRGSNGIFTTPSGQPLSFTIINNGGFSDWVAAVQTIQADLKAVGIQITPRTWPRPATRADLYTGKYQLGYGSETGGPSPFYELRQWLYSANSAPIGKTAGQQLRAVQQPGDRRADQSSTPPPPARPAALDRRPAAEGHAAGRAGDPGYRVGRLVPVQHRQLQRLAHAGRPVRAAGRPTTTPTGAGCCCT